MAFKDTDKILVNRDGVDYQADLGPLMGSGDVTLDLQEVCDNGQITTTGATFGGDVRVNAEVHVNDNLRAHSGVKVRGTIYFLTEDDDDWNGGTGAINNATHLRFNDSTTNNNTNGIYYLEELHFRDSSEFNESDGGKIRGVNGIYMNANEQSDEGNTIAGVNNIFFNENERAEEGTVIAGLNNLFFTENDKTGEPSMIRNVDEVHAGAFIGDGSQLTNLPDGKLTVKDSDDNVLGEFTANQTGDTEVVIPSGGGGEAPNNNRILLLEPVDGDIAAVFTLNQDKDYQQTLPFMPFDIRKLPALGL
jgi:hypothetical protein